MACDLWGPSFPDEDNSYCIQPEWQCDFYFGYGIDMIEENALNEKSCVQVLRILIAKADTEIDELEKELVLLQSELVWDEHEEWHDICCNALRSKINCLDISIKKLRSKDENDIEVFLLMHTEPAEKWHEIVKALLKSFFREEKEQNGKSQDVVLHSRSGSLDNSVALHKNQKSSTSDPCSIVKEENNGPNVTPKDEFSLSNTSMELEVKKANGSETLPNAEVNDLMLHSLRPAAGQFDEKSIVTMLDLETIKKLKESGHTIKDKNAIHHFSPNSVRKRTNSLNWTNVKDAVAHCVNNSDLDASKHSAGHLNKKKKLNSSSLKIVSEEATMNTSISAEDVLVRDSSSNSAGITADLSKKVKDELTANTIAKDLGSITQKQTIGRSDEMKLCTHDLKVNGCEMQGCDTTAIEKSNMSNSCLNPEHKGSIRKAEKVESLKCDMEQKLCNFAVKSARKQCIKEFKVGSANRNQFSNSLLEEEGNRKDSLPVVTQKEAALSDNEHSALTSLAELQDGSEEDKTAHCMEGKPQIEEVQMPEIVSSDGKLVSNLYMRLQRGMVKAAETNVESNPADVEEPDLNSKNVSNSPPFLKGKRANNHTLSYSTGKIIKKTVQHSQRKAEEPSMMPGASESTMSLPQKRCKKLSSVPIVVEIRGSCVQMNISKVHGELNRSNVAKTDFAKSEPSIAPLPSDASSLMKMKMCDLKAIARSQKLKKYSTMKKEDLVKQLENRLSC